MKYVISYKNNENHVSECYVVDSLEKAYNLISGFAKQEPSIFWEMAIKPAKEF